MPQSLPTEHFMQALLAGSPNDDTQIYCYINYDELILGRYQKSTILI